MRNFENQTKLIDLAVSRGDMRTARRLAVKSIPAFIKASVEIKGFEQTYNDILDMQHSNKTRYITQEEINKGFFNDTANAI